MKYGKLAVAAIVLVLSASANAVLVGRLAATPGGTDYQAYYDTEAKLTWRADSTVNSITSWAFANDLVAGLNINGVTGWRLPNTMQPDLTCSGQADGISYGSNCMGSELGNLFYNVLGGVANSSITVTHNTNYDLFTSISAVTYWTGTEYAPNTDAVWFFNFTNGDQNIQSKTGLPLYAWAVHDGDVSAVPVPSAVWLFGSGLIGLIGIAKRKARA